VRYRTDTCTIEAPTVPKQIDRGTACPLGRGPEVLCGVRLIIIYDLETVAIKRLFFSYIPIKRKKGGLITYNITYLLNI